MRMRGVVSFDIDGVLANFTRGFTKIAHDLYGTPVASEQSQQNWMFEDFPKLGLDKEQCAFDGPIWSRVKNDPQFWEALDPMNVSVMKNIDAIRNKIFITNRMGVEPHQQSVRFLEKWGVRAPLVIVTGQKADAANEYGVIAHVDDYYENCVALHRSGPKDCYLSMHYCPYNKRHHRDWSALGGDITLSVEHFIHECEKRGLLEY